MRRRAGLVVVCVSAALAASPARAQVVFEDNFDGNALAPHWVTPPASHWDYDVSAGMLNVHRLNSPSQPGIPFNQAGITSFLPTPWAGDFLATMRIVWESDTVPSVGILLTGTTTQVCTLTYLGDVITYRTPNVTGQVAPGAGAGTHDLAMQRMGNQIRFYLNGLLFDTLPYTANEPMTSVAIGFQHPFPVPAGGSVHVDFVKIVPAPGVSGVMLLSASVILRRRR